MKEIEFMQENDYDIETQMEYSSEEISQEEEEESSELDDFS